jgi:hypothetical protein
MSFSDQEARPQMHDSVPEHDASFVTATWPCAARRRGFDLAKIGRHWGVLVGPSDVKDDDYGGAVVNQIGDQARAAELDAPDSRVAAQKGGHARTASRSREAVSVVNGGRDTISSQIRRSPLARLIRFRGAKPGANRGRHWATQGDEQAS